MKPPIAFTLDLGGRPLGSMGNAFAVLRGDPELRELIGGPLAIYWEGLSSPSIGYPSFRHSPPWEASPKGEYPRLLAPWDWTRMRAWIEQSYRLALSERTIRDACTALIADEPTLQIERRRSCEAPSESELASERKQFGAR